MTNVVSILLQQQDPSGVVDAQLYRAKHLNDSVESVPQPAVG
jgi:hypothetical protein